MRRRTALAAFGLGLLLPLTGCTSTTVKAKEESAQEALTATKKVLDGAKFVALDLSSTNVPERQNGVTAAKGVGQVSIAEPKFTGTITGSIGGVTGQIEVITIKDQTWIKFFTPDYTKTDLASLGAPNPATFFNPEKGISSLLTETSDTKKGEQTRQGKDVLKTYSGTLPGTRVRDLLAVGDAAATFAVTYGITSAHELRTTDLTGPFFEGATSTYHLLLTDYGKTHTITAP